MQLGKVLQKAQLIESMIPEQFGQFITDLSEAYRQLNDPVEQSHVLTKMATQVLSQKDPNPEVLPYFEQIISEVITYSIEKQFLIGADALRYIFDASQTFYKGARIDQNSEYPLGLTRPLQKYTPQVGEECDVIRPYITSVGTCWWTRCKVTSFENGKYGIEYLNSEEKSPIREYAHFAPLGSRTPEFEWRLGLEMGAAVDAFKNRVWYPSTIAEMAIENNIIRARVTFRRFSEEGDRVDTHGNKYFGLDINEDEWMEVTNGKIQPPGTMVHKKLCYYSATSEDTVFDDSYEYLLFRKEYEQKPFHAVMRMTYTRSLCYLNFVNIFIEKGGFEATMKLMNNPDAPNEHIFSMLLTISRFINLIPRMELNIYLPVLYRRIFQLYRDKIKVINGQWIDMAFFCFDTIGRRLYALSQLYEHERELRQYVILEFLQLNMEKQMLALRYLYELINPTRKPYSDQQEMLVNKYLSNNKIFQKLFQNNLHEQIISRSVGLLRYLLQKNIVGEEQIQSLWYSVPLNDQRGRSTIEKLLADVSKALPLSFIEKLLKKLMNLKETELTPENLNLLREIKNRQLTHQSENMLLNYLWDLITEKSKSMKESIEEEVLKVFKVFILGIKNISTRKKVLQSMLNRFDTVKNLTYELDLLKDFLLSYPEKLPMDIEDHDDAPTTLYEAISYIKKQNIYERVLKLFMSSKQKDKIQEILQFLIFLFEYDDSDIQQILNTIYGKLGPTENFFKWIQKMPKRVLPFMVNIFKSADLSQFENLSSTGYSVIQDILLRINQAEGKIRVLVTRKMQPQKETKDAETNTPNNEKKQNKMGPHLPDEIKHIFVLVSPSKIVGTTFLQKLLPIIKSSQVYNEIIKLLIQFVVQLDETIEDKTSQYRSDFLNQIMKMINQLTKVEEMDQKVKKTIEAYFHLIIELFAETEKHGMGDMQPHFQQVEGEIFTLKVENQIDSKQKKFTDFEIKANENLTVWKLKEILSAIVEEIPENIDVYKGGNTVKENLNGKAIGQLFFYDNQKIRIEKKQGKDIPKYNLLTSDGTRLSLRFSAIILKWFNEFKTLNEQITPEGLKKLSGTHWKGTLFKDEEKLAKTMDSFDQQKKGSLSLAEFQSFFYDKSQKNPHAIWKILNLSGYLNNLRHKDDPIKVQKNHLLPRRILSCAAVYNVIFQAFQNIKLESVHLNFYRLLTLLEVDAQSKSEIQLNGPQIIAKNPSLYRVSYTLEVLNAQISKKGDYFYDFYKRNGLGAIRYRLNEIMKQKESIYSLDVNIKMAVIPNMIKIFSMYLVPLSFQTKEVRIFSKQRLNNMDIQDVVKREKQFKQSQTDNEEAAKIAESLKKINEKFQIHEYYTTLLGMYHNMLRNFNTDSTDYIPKLANEVIRSLSTVVLSTDFMDPQQLLYGIKNDSLNYRRGCCNIIHLYIKKNEKYVEGLLMQLLKQMPTESKYVFTTYFLLLAEIIGSYVENAPEDKNQFMISLANTLLDKLIDNLPSQHRTALMADKVLIGVLMAIETLMKRETVKRALLPRKQEIINKCLFFYCVKEKLDDIQIPDIVLAQESQPEHFPFYIKCKTEQTRKHMYSIVKMLHQISREEDPHFLQNYVMPVANELPDNLRKTDNKSMKVGLHNFGSTCYMNSMLQILNSIGPFRNLLMQTKVEAPLVIEMKKLFSYLFYSERLDYAPKQMLDAFVPPINPGIQQDTTEFLNSLCDQLETALSGSPQKKLLDEIFKGAQAAQMICHSCGAKRENREEFFCFSVDIDGKYDLDAALEGSHQGEVISDFYCEMCQNRGETTKRNILTQIPNVFFVHLRRIVFNYDMFVNMKIHTRLQFPQELNIEPYTKQGVQLRESLGTEYMKNLKHDEEESKKFSEMTLHGKEKDFYKMKLKGVIIHSGSADVGHYYSIIPNEKKNGWLKMDDSRASSFPISGFENDCYGGNWQSEEWGGFGSSVNAYVLIYERVVKNPIQIINEEGKTEMIKYQDVQTFNTVDLYKQVWMDNHQFLIESQLLEEEHGKIFISFFCDILKESQNGNQLELMTEMMYRICIQSGQVGSFQSIFQKFVNQITPDLMDNYILKEKKKTFNLLFHFQRPVRDLMSRFLEGVLMKCYKEGTEEHQKKVVDFMKEYLSMLAGDVAKSWLRIDGYFKFFFNMLRQSIFYPELYQVMLNFKLIANLIDVVMEKSSPVHLNPKKYSLGTKTTPVNFMYALEIIFFLLKRSYGFTGVNYETPAIKEAELFHLSDNDVLCLSSMNFYEKMMSEKQSPRLLGAIIQRLSIKNLPFSKAISRILLSSICSVTDMNDEMKELAGLVESIMNINDGFWRERAEAIFGLSSPYVLDSNAMTTLDEERYIFTSTLFDIFPIECLFTYVYLYRLKNRLGCFQLIKAIVKSCSISKEAMQFLGQQPAPSYYYLNYVDWLCDYVPTVINCADPKRKETLVEEIDEVGKYLKDITQIMEETKNYHYYQSHITGVVGQKSTPISLINEEQKVDVLVHEYQVFCMESKPTGKGNESLDNYLDGGRITKQVKDESSILKIMKKPKKPIVMKNQPDKGTGDPEIDELFNESSDHPKLVEESKDNKENIKQQVMMEEIVEELVDIEGIEVNNYFREVQIVNKSKGTKFVKITFDDSENDNVIFPKEMAFKIGYKNSEKLWFGKQVAEKAWPEFKITAVIEDFDKNRKKQQWFKLYGAKGENNENAMIAEVEEPKPPQPQPPSQIQCPICTFINAPGTPQCEICMSDLPPK